MIEKKQFYINGKWVDPLEGIDFEVINPSNEEVCAIISLGGQAAAAAHSLGTPLSTILLTAKELQKEFGNDKKFKKDLDLIVSQSNRTSEILKKLSLNPNINDNFIDSNLSLHDYINEIVRSFEEISNKKFLIDVEYYQNPIKTDKLYFVAKGDGSHVFTSNLEDHNAAVTKYQLKK